MHALGRRGDESVRSAVVRAAGLVVALVVGLVASAASAQTVDDVVRRYLEARGGLAKLRAVQALRLSGTVELPGMPATPFTLELKRPSKMRTEITIEGHQGVRAFDGRTAWAQPPVPGEPPRPMAPEEAAEARAQADVDLSPLVDAAAKGYTVELLGRDRLPGGETWKLLVRGRDEPARTLQLDARTHLVVRTEERRTVEGKEVDFVTEVGDYRTESGLVFPHRIELGPKGSSERQRLVIRSVEVNPPLDEARFSMPSPTGASTTRPSPTVGPDAPAVLP
jgi:outer membrane lipoprotein-sorting protein